MKKQCCLKIGLMYFLSVLLLFCGSISVSCAPKSQDSDPEYGQTKQVETNKRLKVNLLESPMGVEKDKLSFSWMTEDDGKDFIQTAYRIVIARGEKNFYDGIYIKDTGWIKSSQSTAVRIEGLSELLAQDSLYYWSVAVKDRNGREKKFSAPHAFSTAVTQWQSTAGIWAEIDNDENRFDDFVFLRYEFDFSLKQFKEIDRAVLSATARSPEPTRQFVYNLYINGKCVGVGPSRYGKTENGEREILYYNSYDVTDKIAFGKNAIGAICYATVDRSFLCRLKVFYKDGSSEIITDTAADASKWKSLNGDRAFGKSNSVGTGYYTAAANNIDARYYPFEFYNSGFDDSEWKPCCVRAPIDEGLELMPSCIDNVSRYDSPKDRMTITKKEDVYIVDLGREIVGGFRFNIVAPQYCEMEIRFGEQLDSAGHVKFQMLTDNVYVENWKLKEGEQTIETVDLLTYRYVEILNSPTPIRKDMVCGREVRKEWDEEENAFDSDNELLNDLYRLVRHTAKVTSQDLFVDSQSRERCVYEGDCLINMLLSYAFQDDYGVARFSAEYLYTHGTWPSEYVLYCSRMALKDYMTTGDISSLKRYYDVLKTKTFTRYFDAYDELLTDGTITGENTFNRILVDWPEEERGGYDMDVTYNTVFNAVAVASYRELAQIASITGNKTDAAEFSAMADRLCASMIDKLYDPATGAFADGYYRGGKASAHISQHATAFALYGGVYSDRVMADKMAAYLKSRGKIEMSVYGAFFLLEGLYSSGHGDIANALLLDGDTKEGARTWAYMMYSLGATVCAEAWSPQHKDNMTLSHPWGAAPASAIVRGMFGIKCTKAGYETFDVRLCTKPIRRATITVPTVRGKIKVAFERKAQIFSAAVTVPANSQATVYLPAEQESEVWVDNIKTAAVYDNGFVAVTLGSGARSIIVR